MAKVLFVTTESGAIYTLRLNDAGRAWHWEHRGTAYGKVYSLKVLEPGGRWGSQRELFEWLAQQPEADRPEVGKRMFISGSPAAGWRLSTPVIHIHEEEEQWIRKN